MLGNFQQYKQQRQDEETTMKLQGTKRPGNYCEQYKQKRQNQSDPIQCTNDWKMHPQLQQAKNTELQHQAFQYIQEF